MKQNKKLEILEFSDPVCTWCWAAEALLRSLQVRYGDKLAIGYIMGGLVKDIRDFVNLGGTPESANKHLEQNWLEASKIHKMPVAMGNIKLFSAEHPSSYPQNIAYKAAQFEDQGLADQFLRRIREATAVEAKQTNREEVLLALAKEVGLDTEQLRSHYLDGSAEAAFKKDLAMTQAYKVQLLPTFILRYNGRETILENTQNLEEFEQAIETLSANEVTPILPMLSEESVLQFIRTYGRVVPKEIMLAFSVDEQESLRIAHSLEAKREVTIKKAGNGLYIDSVR